jgi:hypothetical protein
MKKSKVTVITDVLMIIISFIFVILTVLSHKYLTNYRQHTKILFFVEPDPIKSIEVSRWNCRKGYEHFVNDEYPGIYGGCYLPTLNLLLKKNCSDESISFIKKRISIPEIEKTKVYFWRNTNLCVERYKFDNVEYEYIPESRNCSEGFRKCGKIDIFNYLCVGESFECPITDLKFQSREKPYRADYNPILLGDNKTMLLYTNVPQLKNNTFIPTDFTISPNIPCIDNSKISNSSDVFPLAKEPERYGCNYKYVKDPGLTYLDFRWEDIDVYDKISFYGHNELSELMSLPNMTMWSSAIENNMYLFLRTGSKLNYECFDKSRKINFYYSVRTLKIDGFKMIIYSLANMLILSIFLSLIKIIKIGNKIQNILLNFIKICFSILFIVAILLLIEEMKDQSKDVLDVLKMMEDEKCLDKNSYHIYFKSLKVDQYINNWDNTMKTIFIISYIYVGLAAIQVLKFIHKTYLRIRNNRRNKEGVNVLKQAINLRDIK